MTANPVGRIVAIAWATFRGSLSGGRVVALAFLAAVYPAVVGVIAAAQFPNVDLTAASETLFSNLFLPILLLIVCLVLGVGLFRNEVEEDTLVYLTSRSVPRSSVVLGKYAGFLLSALLILLPSAILGTALGVAYNLNPAVGTTGLLPAVLLMTLFATLAYGAFFLLLGLVTRYALVGGLLYGFIWETFVPLLPGPIKEVTVVYYLRAVGADFVSSGPLSSGGATASPASVAVGVLLMAVLSIAMAAAYLEWAEVRPTPSPQ